MSLAGREIIPMMMKKIRMVIPIQGELTVGCMIGGILWKIGFTRLLLFSFEDIIVLFISGGVFYCLFNLLSRNIFRVTSSV